MGRNTQGRGVTPAANPIFESVPLSIDGVEYRLVYDFAAIAEAERAINRGRLLADHVNLLVSVVGVINAASLPALFWAALQPHHPDITLDQATALIRKDTAMAIYRAVGAAHELSRPEATRKDPTQASANEGEPAAG